MKHAIIRKEYDYKLGDDDKVRKTLVESEIVRVYASEEDAYHDKNIDNMYDTDTVEYIVVPVEEGEE